MNINDIEIERSVIGEILSFESLKEKALLLEPGDFAYDEHRDICKAMISQAKNGKYDFVTVAAECGSSYRAEIQNCIQTAISEALFEEHFKILKEMASRRRLISRFQALTLEGDVSVSSLQKMLDDENSKRIASDVKEISERNIDAFVAELNKRKGTLMTGFGNIDKVTGGIRKSTVFIIGARPSTGKTTFALNIAANQIADPEKKVMFFSLEMSSEMIYERLMAAQNKIEYEKFSRNSLSEDEIKLIAAQSKKLKESESFFVIDDVYNVEQICNMISENKPSLAVVDFMQIISAVGKFENVRSRIDYISSLFKRTAKTTGCVIIVLSQLSRMGKEAPTMSDLKESGGLEQDGDYIALLHRPYVLNKNENECIPEDTQLLLDKNKFGRTGKIDLWFDLKHQRFYERDERWDTSGTPFEEEIKI